MNDNFSSLIDILNEIKDNLLKRFSKGTTDNFGYEFVDGRSIDYCFWNLLRSKNRQFVFIDKKWAYEGFLTADDVLFRSLNGLYYDVYYYVTQIPFSEFIVFLLSRIYKNYDVERLHKNIRVDLDFSNSIVLFPKSIDDYLSRDEIGIIRIKPDDIIQLQANLNDFRLIQSGRAWKLLGKYYSIRDYIKKVIRRDS